MRYHLTCFKNQKITQRLSVVYSLLKPILDQRLADMEKPDFKPPPDLIQLVIDGTKGKGRSLDYQVNAQIGTGRASLFTTGVTISHLIYDLCAHPEFIEPLREEVLALGDAKMNRATVAKLEKMDSFIRECQRWNKFLLGKTRRTLLNYRQVFQAKIFNSGNYPESPYPTRAVGWDRPTRRHPYGIEYARGGLQTHDLGEPGSF